MTVRAHPRPQMRQVCVCQRKRRDTSLPLKTDIGRTGTQDNQGEIPLLKEKTAVCLRI